MSDGPKADASNPQQIVYASIGSSVKLECVARSVPSSRYEWRQNGFLVNQNVNNFNDLSRLTVSFILFFE